MVAHQSLLSMEFSRQESQSGLLFPTPGDLPDPGIEPVSLASPPLTGEFFMVPPRKPLDVNTYICQSLSHVQLFVTSQTIAHQAPLSMEFSSQEYWSRQPFPSLGDLPAPEVERVILHHRQILYHLSHQGSSIDVNRRTLLVFFFCQVDFSSTFKASL